MPKLETGRPPGPVRDAIERRTGPLSGFRSVDTGWNHEIAFTAGSPQGPVFVKGLPSENSKVAGLKREAGIASYVQAVSPKLLHHFEDTGWTILVFREVPGRTADYRPGSGDLRLVAGLLQMTGSIPVPSAHEPVKRAEDRWRDYVPDPGSALTLAGGTLLHTDLLPANVLVTQDGAWLVDWAWPTFGAPWIDAACWLVCLLDSGHTVPQAEWWAGQVPAYARAAPRDIDVLARALAKMWTGIAGDQPGTWTESMAAAAREWEQARRDQARARGEGW